ncbi:MAG TPA: MarR family transcriptional regulator [Candidatus Baltobacterales bacterium]|nr:MarR family transcriptional regulator [Candidatus Baltobacterales bacterium]
MTERPIDPGRGVWGLFLDPVLDLLKSHVLAHYAEHRLTSSQACLLQRLNHPMPQREAALQLGYDPSNITALADVLETKGLVERRHDPSDRRVKTLARTAEGDRLVRELDESLSRPPESLNRLSPDEQAQLLRLLSKAFGPTT